MTKVVQRNMGSIFTRTAHGDHKTFKNGGQKAQMTFVNEALDYHSRRAIARIMKTNLREVILAMNHS
jgi:hypothetical protein